MFLVSGFSVVVQLSTMPYILKSWDFTINHNVSQNQQLTQDIGCTFWRFVYVISVLADSIRIKKENNVNHNIP